MKEFLEENIDSYSIKDLINGYVYIEKERKYICLFCGEIFDEDFIYRSKFSNNLINGRRAVKEHIELKHGGSFNFLINLDKSLTGLTDRQREIFKLLFKEEDNRVISEKMNTTPATIRSYKYKKKERIRQSKVFLAIAALIDMSNELPLASDNKSILPGLDSGKSNPSLISSDDENLKLISNILGKKNLDFNNRGE